MSEPEEQNELIEQMVKTVRHIPNLDIAQGVVFFGFPDPEDVEVKEVKQIVERNEKDEDAKEH